MLKLCLLFISLFSFTQFTKIIAQEYSIVIKGGHLIDPNNKIDEVMDIAVSNGRIAKVDKNIDPKSGRQVVSA